MAPALPRVPGSRSCTRRAAPLLCLIVAPMARVLFDGVGSTIEAGQIRDVSLTTRVTQSATLHGVLITIQPPSHDHTRSGRPKGAARTTMKQYKPLLSSAPANSILNAQRFRYTNSASTDIRKTFASVRRNTSKQKQPGVATNVRTLTKKAIDAPPAPSSLASLRRSSGGSIRYNISQEK